MLCKSRMVADAQVDSAPTFFFCVVFKVGPSIYKRMPD